MQKCFVIQPFDAGKFDKRYEDVYAPAIRAADLEPYRVDRDPEVDVPIEAIEEGIRSAAACLADITTDNPNVWYELGFAFASNRPVVMVCSDERTGKKYPFDIQHRTITSYQAESTRDFETLGSGITTRLKTLVDKTQKMRALRESEQVAPVQGLSQPELAVLVSVAGSVAFPKATIPVVNAKNDTELAGFTAVAFSIGLKRLSDKGFLSLREAWDVNNEPYQGVSITPEGWDWIERNEAQFILRKPTKEEDNEKEMPF